MNVTSTHFATKTRTWLFIAALIALIGIGALIGATFLYTPNGQRARSATMIR